MAQKGHKVGSDSMAEQVEVGVEVVGSEEVPEPSKVHVDTIGAVREAIAAIANEETAQALMEAYLSIELELCAPESNKVAIGARRMGAKRLLGAAFDITKEQFRDIHKQVAGPTVRKPRAKKVVAVGVDEVVVAVEVDEVDA